MKLKELCKNLKCEIIGDTDIEINGLQYDSRKVSHGDVFICIKGYKTDGHKYAANAMKSGASALIADHYLEDLDIPQIIVEDTRKAMAETAAKYYNYPARKMKMVGVTGTNGKTTTTYMIKRIAEAAGYKVGLLGTICNMIGDKSLYTDRTTPESLDLQMLLAEMVKQGCNFTVMEVSSHSLFLKRVFGIEFDVGIFTNLTQDHLDFHKNMKDYALAKSLIFSQSKIALINKDDSYASLMEDKTDGEIFTYGIYEDCDFKGNNIVLHAKGVNYDLIYDEKLLKIALPIPGLFSVYNSMAAVSASILMGITASAVIQSLSEINQVPGRFELLDTKGKGFSIILDYAHTPDSLENTLKTIKEFSPAKVLTVFGCGGNRDATKRPIMGKIAEQYSDYVIVTSDNPRFEEPKEIIKDIEIGLEKDNHICIENRKDGIAHALLTAEKDDIILLAGKGHETYQEIKGVKYDFDEKVIVAELLDDLFI